MNTGLKDRVAIVAASSQGIGRSTAYALAAEGCKVALCARNESALAFMAHDISKKLGVEVFYRAVDVTNPEAVKSFVEGVAANFRRIDICVTNAGGPPSKMFLELGPDDWRKAVRELDAQLHVKWDSPNNPGGGNGGTAVPIRESR